MRIQHRIGSATFFRLHAAAPWMPRQLCCGVRRRRFTDAEILRSINDSCPLSCFQSPVSLDFLSLSFGQFLRGLPALRAAGCLSLIISVDLMAIGTAAGHECSNSIDRLPVNPPDSACFVSMVLSGKSGSRLLQRFPAQQRSRLFTMNFDKVLSE